MKMNFITTTDHAHHDVHWAIYSNFHLQPVCIGCLVETIKSSDRLPLQKKPALTELLRLFTNQYDDLLPLFVEEERIVWHITSVLLVNLTTDDEPFQALTTETLLKLLDRIGSEELVHNVIENIVEKTKLSHDVCQGLPMYSLVGKMLFQFPGLASTMTTRYEEFLHVLSLELCKDNEAMQSAVCYIFIYILDREHQRVSLRILHQVYCGIIEMLCTAQLLPVLTNGLGLLKRLILKEDACQNLISIRTNNNSLLTCLKKLLLSKKEVLQLGACQMLAHILSLEDSHTYGLAILESDLVEFLFEALNTEKPQQIESIFKILRTLSGIGQFYKRCHAVYGVESMLRALVTAHELKIPALLVQGHAVLGQVLNRHPVDIPLFLSPTVVLKCLQVIQHGLEHQQEAVFYQALDTFRAIICRRFLLTPVPFQELTAMVSMVTARIWEELGCRPALFHHGGTTHKTCKPVASYVGLLTNCSQLCVQCRTEKPAQDISFAPPTPGAVVRSPLEELQHCLLSAADESCLPLVMMHWETAENTEWYVTCLELLCALDNMDAMATKILLYKLLESGFLSSLQEVKVKYGSPLLISRYDHLLMLIVQCCQEKGILPSDVEPETIIQPGLLKWNFSKVHEVLRMKLPEGTMDSYLAVLYLSVRLDNSLVDHEELSVLLAGMLEHQKSVEEMPPLAQKHFIYLLAYNCISQSIEYSELVRDGESICRVLNSMGKNLYTHDITLLEWVFLTPQLASTCGESMLSTFLQHCSLSDVERMLHSLSDLRNSSSDSRTTLESMASNTVFLNTIVQLLATSNASGVTKLQLIFEKMLTLSWETWQMEQMSDIDEQNEEKQMSMVSRLTEHTTDVMLQVFFKSYPDSGDHNITGLMETLLMLFKFTPKCTVSIKIIYHGLLSKADLLSPGLHRACFLIILIAITPTDKSTTQTCAIVAQHDSFMEHLQECVVERFGEVIFCIVSDILCIFMDSQTVKCAHQININLIKIFMDLTNMNIRNPDRKVSVLCLFKSLLNCGMKHDSINVQGSFHEDQYHAVFIALQQLCLEDIPDLASASMECIVALIQFLLDVTPHLGDSLLEQPWNVFLVDLVLELRQTSPLAEAHWQFINLLLENDSVAVQIRLNPGMVPKLSQLGMLCGTGALNKCQMRLVKNIHRTFYSDLTDEERSYLQGILVTDSTIDNL